MKPRDQPPPAAEHAKLRTYLALKGVQASDVAAAVGNAPAGRSRRDIAAALTAWLRTGGK